MDEQPKTKSTSILKVIPKPFEETDEYSKQNQQHHDTPLTHLLAPTSLSTKVKDVNLQQNLESITLIWYDSNINKTADMKQTVDELREINNGVMLYTDFEACFAHIESIATEKIFLVISGRGASRILVKVHELPQVDSIFIFCRKPERYEKFYKNKSKLIGIYTDRHDLLNSLKESIIGVEKHSVTFNFYNQHKRKNTRDLSKESAEFLWFQMFKDVILRMPRDSRAKQQMIKFCRDYYCDNEQELDFIREFEHDYKSNMAIRWYTRETFLYKIINKALRTENIEQLHTFRFFIADLSLNLAAEYEKLKRKDEKIISLYRGLKMEKEELETLKQNKGNLISTNGFLSTSHSKEQAIMFAREPDKRTNTDSVTVSVLFEIVCNIEETDSVIFADIAEYSDYPEEEEFLFDLGSTFEIVSVKNDAQLNLDIVELKTTDKGSKVAKEHIELNRKYDAKSVELIFGKLLIDMGQYDQSLKYFQSLLSSDQTQKDDIANINNLIGMTYYQQRNFYKALKYFKLAYSLMMNDEPRRIKESAKSLANIGLVYQRNCRYTRALELYMKSIEIFDIYYGKDHIKATKTLMNIGNIYTDTEEYQHALKYYQNVLKIQKKYLPSDHLEIAMTLNNIAVAYEKLDYIDRALEYYQQSLNMKQRILPPSHEDITVTEDNIAHLNYRKNYIDEYSTRSDEKGHKLHYPALSVVRTKQTPSLGGPAFDYATKYRSGTDYNVFQNVTTQLSPTPRRLRTPDQFNETTTTDDEEEYLD